MKITRFEDATLTVTPGRQLTVREAKKQACRREIASAAVSLFEEKGFAAATMDEIAARSGVSRPTVFNYFAHKEDVLTFAMGLVFESKARNWLALEPQKCAVPSERIADLLAALAETYGEYPNSARAFQPVIIDALRSVKEVYPNSPLVVGSDLVTALVERGQALGHIRGDFTASEMAWQLFVGLFAATFDPWRRTRLVGSYSRLVRKYMDLYLHGMQAQPAESLKAAATRPRAR